MQNTEKSPLSYKKRKKSPIVMHLIDALEYEICMTAYSVLQR